MKLITGLAAILLPVLCPAQPKPLSIGDSLPAITLDNIYNYRASSISLNELKGKLIILDFWSTRCGACIAAMPALQDLQAQFNDKLQVILVNPFTFDSIEKVKAFFKRREAITGRELTLPYSLLQADLKAYFPFEFIPHEIWIDPTGLVVAITSQTEVTAENIEKMLANRGYNLHTKQDLVNFSAELPLLINGNGGNSGDFIGRSLFTKYIEGINNTSGIQQDANGRLTRFYMFNAMPIQLLRTAYPGELNQPLNRIIVETADSSFNVLSAAPTQYYSNAFCYDLSLPAANIAMLESYVQADLKKYLGLIVATEKRRVRCLVLKKAHAGFALASHGGTPAADFDSLSRQMYLKNQPFTSFTDLLNNLPVMRHLPIVDEAGITCNIDIELPPNFYTLSLSGIKAFLKTHGINTLETGRMITIAVIKNN